MGAAFEISQYFQFALGDSPLATGLRLLPWTATPIVVAPLAGALSDRLGARPLMAAGLLLQAAGLTGFAVLAGHGGGYLVLVLPLVVAGVGVSMALSTTASAALGAVRPADVGTASGVNSTMQRFGGAFGVAIATAVFAAHGHLGSPAAFTAGFRPALVAVAALSLIGGLAALGVRRAAAPAPSPQPEPAAA